MKIPKRIQKILDRREKIAKNMRKLKVIKI